MLIIRRSKLHYTASGIFTPIGGRLVHSLREMHGQQNVKIKSGSGEDPTLNCMGSN